MGRKKRKKRKSQSPRQTTRRASLSLCMIVKDEAHNLPDCLRYIKKVVDEIVVVDTGSVDETKSIAKDLGARVFHFDWCDDFAAARNESIHHARGDYILWLDADDRVDPNEIAKIKQLRKILSRSKDKAFYVVVNSHWPTDGDSQFLQLRIFPKLAGVRFEGRIHEQIFHKLQEHGVELVQTDIIIRHTGYDSAEAVLQKGQRNLQIILDELREDLDNPVLHYNAGRTLAALGRYEQAVAHMEKARTAGNLKEEHPDFYLAVSLLAGQYYLQSGKIGQAESMLKDLARQFPRNGLVRFYYGQSLFESGRYEEAIRDLAEALSLPLEVSVFAVNMDLVQFQNYYLLGLAYKHLGDLDSACTMLQKSLGRHGQHYLSMEELGKLELQRGNYQTAASYFNKAIKEGAASDANYANLGLACSKVNDTGKAEKAFLEALELNPDCLAAHSNLGHLYCKLQDYHKALKHFGEALRLAPDLVDVRLALSSIFFRLQQVEPLVAECDTLLAQLNLPRDLTLNNVEELAALYSRIGATLIDQGRTEVGLMAHMVSLEMAPSLEILKEVATVAGRIGRLNEYLAQIRQILASQGQDQAIEHIARTLDAAAV
ncbi:MAG: tetratricopeptide repeat protein [Deltaproteobacteria bacterium]|nr:tetratricopeptide repeat protein [Deltaproteobacteria bacterium]MBW2071768.1 tetratricopeptide repeat protein [Deltaproteobacteria bacterium]